MENSEKKRGMFVNRMGDFDYMLEYAYSLIENGEYEKALPITEELILVNRLNLMANLLLAEAYYAHGQYLKSYKYYMLLLSLQNKYKEQLVEDSVLKQQIETVIANCREEQKRMGDEERRLYQKAFIDVKAIDKSIELNMFSCPFDMKDYFGIHEWFRHTYYLARYDNWYCSYMMLDKCQNGQSCKGEIYEIACKGEKYEVNDEFPCIVPVLSDERGVGNQITFVSTTKKTSFADAIVKSYMYYRFDEPTQIWGSSEMYFGKPIILKHQEGNKRLVLNIFLDSFNWYFIKKHSLDKYMPNTKKFFERGIICDNFYAGSEFTYPSVASYWTGLRSTHHKMLNQNVHYPIQENVPLISEIFQENGYFTAKIGGNDSVTPNYGYIRGIDRFVYGFSEQNFHVQDSVYETLEHLRTFGDTDNFIWMEIQDLHEVSGHLKMPISVQGSCLAHTNEIDNIGGSSLYQTHSANREEVYAEQMKRIDFYLGQLYQYIDENYKREEVLVTFISDHGNGYIVEDGESFLSPQRMNVPFMVYGDKCEEQVSDELMETIDYGHVLCHLAGIDDSRLENDGMLPVFFGGSKEKEYVFSQSLFPGRYYEASILTKGYCFYFKSSNLVSNDCRIALQGQYYLRDSNGQEIENHEVETKCVDIMKEILGDFLIR